MRTLSECYFIFFFALLVLAFVHYCLFGAEISPLDYEVVKAISRHDSCIQLIVDSLSNNEISNFELYQIQSCSEDANKHALSASLDSRVK